MMNNSPKTITLNAYCMFILAASFYCYEMALQVAPSNLHHGDSNEDKGQLSGRSENLPNASLLLSHVARESQNT